MIAHLKTATMSCWRRMLIWSLVDYSSAEPLMPPGTNVLLHKQQLSEKCALWFCNLLFREWIWMLLCWWSRWLWSKLLSGRLEVESSFAHSSCLESHNALFSIFGRRHVRNESIRLTSTSAADMAYLTYRCYQEKSVIRSMFINTASTCNVNWASYIILNVGQPF